MYTQEDFEKLKTALSKIDLLKGESNAIGSYKSAVLICLDAVLSINRKYYSFVVPRIKKFQEGYPGVNTLFKLRKLIGCSSVEEFSKIWNYNHPQRVEILNNLVNNLIEYANIKPTDETEIELRKLRDWASSLNVYNFKTFNVAGIGIATYQYIRMMLGVKTVKPDVYIKRYVQSVLNKKLNEKDLIDIFEKSCNSANIDVAQADHSLWKQYAKDVDIQFVWENDKWATKK